MKKNLVEVKRNPTRYQKIIGVDTSSQSIAWSYIYRGRLVKTGKIDMSKAVGFNAKMRVFDKAWEKILDEIKPDRVWVEKSIFVRNPATARILSYVVGSVMMFTGYCGYEVDDVEPSTWKAFCGYTNLSSKFVVEAKKKLGPTEGKKFCERLRKSQTRRIIEHNYPKWVIPDDHDIADSVGIALWGYNLLVKEVNLEKSKDISIDQKELARLGLKL